jgi:hypothetical protein
MADKGRHLSGGALSLFPIGIVLLVVSVIRQGHGHARALVHDTVGPTDTTSGGTVTVDGRVAEQAIHQALAGHPGLVSSCVSTYLGREVPVVIQINSGLASRVSRPARFAPQEQKGHAAPPRPSAVPATRVETATDQTPR